MNHLLNVFFSRPAIWLAVCAVALLSASPASAVTGGPLAPGGTQYNPYHLGAFSFLSPDYTPTSIPSDYSLVTSANVPYNYNGTTDGSFYGFVTTSVYMKTDGTDKGTLLFAYVFNNLTPPTPPNPPLTDIVKATISDPTHPWGPFQITSAGADTSGHSTAVSGFFGSWSDGTPFSIQRDATDFGVSANFNPLNSGTQLNSTPNDQSAVIWFATDATKFAATDVGLSDNGHVGTTRAYAPNLVQGPFLPEPSTLVLLALGGSCGVLTIWRRRQNS